MNKSAVRVAIGTGLILLIPLILTLVNPGAHINGGSGGGWDWSPFDFVWAGVLIFGTGSLFEIARKKAAGNTAYKIAAGVGLATAFILIWINGAVGIIGEDNGSNLIYFATLGLGFLHVCLSRFEPKGMARAMFVTATGIALVPVVALIIGIPDFRPGIVPVFMLNTAFALLFAGSGLLFRRAANPTS